MPIKHYKEIKFHTEIQISIYIASTLQNNKLRIFNSNRIQHCFFMARIPAYLIKPSEYLHTVRRTQEL